MMMPGRIGRAVLSLALFSTVVLVAPPSAEAVSWPSDSVRVSVEAGRLAGADRYATAVEIARQAFPRWEGVEYVVVASGEDRALSDPLAAAGLAGVFDAPLLLVHSGGLPNSVRSAIADMPSGVKVVIVGGTTAVPRTVGQALERIDRVGSIERVEGADRFQTAHRIAERMRSELSARGEEMPKVALLANGSDPETFSDALSLAAVSAGTGAPVLLLERSSIPASTAIALRDLGLARRIVAGGYRTVSGSVVNSLRAERWAGPDRYATAGEISRRAVSEGWAQSGEFGLAAQLSDALSGGSVLGRRGGTLLLTDATALPQHTARTLAVAPASARTLIFGGPASVSDSVLDELRGSPAQPSIVGPAAPLGYVGKRGRVVVRTGSNTTGVRIYHGDRRIATRAAGSFATVDLGVIDLPEGVLRVVAHNPDGKQTASERRLRRLSYPAATSIVVDKSDFKLYWVRNDVLVKAYPVGIGRTNAETPGATWRIDSKYHTDPRSVYGPRKMRMYRKAGARYVYTAYNIHGTNQPWAIGTKVSSGCIRMYNEDVLELFPQVSLGTIVVTRE